MTEPSQLRVAVIEPSGRLYGSEYCLLDIVSGTPREWFEWRVFLPEGRGLDRLLEAAGVACDFSMPADLSDRSRPGRLLVYLRVLARLRALDPDLIYVNQTGSLRAAASYARLLRTPIVCQVQTLEDARWLSSQPGLQSPVQAFICNSDFIASATKVDSSRKCTLYQGIPVERTNRARRNAEKAERSRDTETFKIGILGRIAHSKGHYLLLDAAKALHCARDDFRYVVIGEGLTDRDTEAFRSAVHREGLDDLFDFRGYRSNLAEELDRLHVLTIPSIAEPLGRVLFDAAEQGVPVVLSDAGGLGELSKRFGIGVRFASGSAQALATALSDVAGSYEETVSDFRVAAVAMLESLSMEPYLEVVAEVLRRSASGKPTRLEWLGESRACP